MRLQRLVRVYICQNTTCTGSLIYEVMSVIDVTSSIKIDKPLVVYILLLYIAFLIMQDGVLDNAISKKH